MMNQVKISELEVPVPWGFIRGQIFKSDSSTKPLVALAGYLDNSNSFKPISEYLNKAGFYVIAIDFPGHGFSSYFPTGMPYTLLNFMMSIRRVIKYLEIEKFSFLAHSFGTFVALMYSMAFHDEIEKFIGLDSMIIVDLPEAVHNIPTYWRQSTDLYTSAENQTEKFDESTPLTIEKGLKTMLQQNTAIDEKSALLLLERAMINENGKLRYTRDRLVKIFMSHLEARLVTDLLEEHFKAPFLLIYAHPQYLGNHGKKIQGYLLSILKSRQKQNHVEAVRMDGTHCFHMMKPEETSKIIVEFLNKNTSTGTNSKL